MGFWSPVGKRTQRRQAEMSRLQTQARSSHGALGALCPDDVVELHAAAKT